MSARADGGGDRSAPVRRALWYVEAHLARDLALDDVAAVSGVSRFRLARTFLAVTGMPVMHYQRRRRLTEAARALAAGAPDILAVALNWGYGSHEAFTRAFRAQFGRTPEQVRREGALGALALTETMDVDNEETVALDPPRIVNGEALRIVGLAERYTFATIHGIPSLWQRFVPRIETIAHRVGNDTFGVCCAGGDDADLEYVAAVAVSRFDDVPAGMRRIELPPRRYAVFVHSGHIADIRRTTRAVWTHGLAAGGLEPIEAPDFERYGDAFDPETGFGTVEIWVAVAG
ncbi:MAG: AraC family transcriptional regulator [Pseudomonadales bacterium]